MKKKIKYTEGDLPYLIIVDGSVIARFENSQDREYSLSILKETFDDINFEIVDEE